jgi:hypothetical protein
MGSMTVIRSDAPISGYGVEQNDEKEDDGAKNNEVERKEVNEQSHTVKHINI